MPISPLCQRLAYTALAEHHAKIEDCHLRDLFAEDPDRGERLSAEAAGLYLDYSKNRITEETVNLLIRLAEQSDLEERRNMMFAGERINVSENRSVLHVALRMPKGATLIVDGVDVVAQVHEAHWWRCTSTACSRREPFGASTLSTNGASSLAKRWPQQSSPSWKAMPSPSSITTHRPTS
jgi:Phosphoglucose isomerase